MKWGTPDSGIGRQKEAAATAAARNNRPQLFSWEAGNKHAEGRLRKFLKECGLIRV